MVPEHVSTARCGLPSDVLVLTHGTEPWSRAVLVGLALASRWGSQLSGCAISSSSGDPDLPEPTLLGLLTPDMDVEHMAADARAFAALAEQHGVAKAQWIPASAGVAPTLQQLGAWHDLIVIERDLVDRAERMDHLGEVILGCRRPCLMPPAYGREEVRFARVAIGWNGSIEATRAIHAALPFLLAADQVTLIDGSAHRTDEEAASPAFDPARYLARHGISSRHVILNAALSHAGEALLHEVVRVQADLLVMGGYSHSRVSERVFGGATRHMLGHAQLALLMQH